MQNIDEMKMTEAEDKVYITSYVNGSILIVRKYIEVKGCFICNTLSPVWGIMFATNGLIEIEPREKWIGVCEKCMKKYYPFVCIDSQGNVLDYKDIFKIKKIILHKAYLKRFSQIVNSIKDKGIKSHLDTLIVESIFKKFS
jgi:hypothetical protein